MTEGTIAAFDVDGTLTTRDCVVPFLRRVAGAGGLVGGTLRHSGAMVARAARRDRDGLKALAATAAFRGRRCADVEAEGERFADHVAERWLRLDVVDRLRRHVADGHVAVLVSASFEVYLRPLAERLGAAGPVGVVGTRLVCRDGLLTGELDGPNCRGPEKVVRLDDWLDRHEGGRRGRRLVAYGDSPGDRELLAAADDAHWVGRRSHARAVVT